MWKDDLIIHSLQTEINFLLKIANGMIFNLIYNYTKSFHIHIKVNLITEQYGFMNIQLVYST